MGFSEVFLTAAGYMEAIEEGSPGSPLDDGMMGQSTNVYHIPWQFWLVMGKKAYESSERSRKIKDQQTPLQQRVDLMVSSKPSQPWP